MNLQLDQGFPEAVFAVPLGSHPSASSSLVSSPSMSIKGALPPILSGFFSRPGAVDRVLPTREGCSNNKDRTGSFSAGHGSRDRRRLDVPPCQEDVWAIIWAAGDLACAHKCARGGCGRGVVADLLDRTHVKDSRQTWKSKVKKGAWQGHFGTESGKHG